MSERTRALRQRQAAIAPRLKQATAPVRPEAMGGPGGGTKYVVLRTWAADAMTAQELAYLDPADPIEGEIEAVGEPFAVYPPPGFGFAAFEAFVYATADEATYPLGRRVWPLRAHKVGGKWYVEPALKIQPNVEFIDGDAEISAGSGG